VRPGFSPLPTTTETKSTHDGHRRERPDRSHATRLAAHSAVPTALALQSDHALGELQHTAEPLGSGIGGQSVLVEVAGKPVLVERVPLTELELRPGHLRSTANLFEVPTCCQ
jgi:hypothetical protein